MDNQIPLVNPFSKPHRALAEPSTLTNLLPENRNAWIVQPGTSAFIHALRTKITAIRATLEAVSTSHLTHQQITDSLVQIATLNEVIVLCSKLTSTDYFSIPIRQTRTAEEIPHPNL